MRHLMRAALPLVLLVSSLGAQDGFSDALIGAWMNVDSGTRGLTRIVIDRSGAEYRIHAWGKCHPQDCDLGMTQLDLIGNSIQDENPDHAIATWNHGFSILHLLIRLEGTRMVVESYTVFRDRSGRKSYRTLDLLRRSR